MHEAAVRRLEMLEVLHRRGRQLLRGTPSIAPSGIYWRLSIRAAGCDEVYRWTTGTGDDGLAPDDLADGFLAAHPTLAEAGRGDDPAYAAWWSGAADLARRGWLPYFHADWPTDDVEGVPLSGPEAGRPVLPWPPAG